MDRIRRVGLRPNESARLSYQTSPGGWGSSGQQSTQLRLLALGRHYDRNFQILSKNFRPFFFLTKWNMIQHTKKGYFLIEKIKEFRSNSELFSCWLLILLSWKAKVSHDFWTKFGNANRSCTSNRRAYWQKACTQKQDELLINKDEKSHFFQKNSISIQVVVLKTGGFLDNSASSISFQKKLWK